MTPLIKITENKLKSSAVNDVKAGCSKDITPKNDSRRKSSDFPSSKKNKGNIPKSPDCTEYESNISCVLTPKRDGKKKGMKCSFFILLIYIIVLFIFKLPSSICK